MFGDKVQFETIFVRTFYIVGTFWFVLTMADVSFLSHDAPLLSVQSECPQNTRNPGHKLLSENYFLSNPSDCDLYSVCLSACVRVRRACVARAQTLLLRSRCGAERAALCSSGRVDECPDT